MVVLRVSIITALLGLAQFISAQVIDSTRFKLIATLDVQGASLASDYMGNTYVFDENEIRKFSSKGELIASFSEKNAGTIASVDASNPLRVQVFYQDFGQIIYLDDVLSIIGAKISLIDQDLDQATLSCSSWDDGIWLYDPQDFELKRLGSDMQISHQSGNINQLISGELNPSYIIEKNNFVYLNDPEQGILVFDQFGTYYKTLPVKNIERFQVGHEHVYFLQDDKLNSYSLKTFLFSELEISSDKEGIKDMKFEKELKLLALLKEKKLELLVIKD